MKILFQSTIILCLSFFAESVLAQSAEIIRQENGKGIPNVSVRLFYAKSNQSFVTDRDGKTPLPDEWKNDTLIITASGYSSITVLPSMWLGEKLTVELQEFGVNMKAFEISATRMQADILSLPLDIIKLSLPVNLSPRNLADALEQSGEVFVQRSQLGGGSPVLRGMEANRILLVVDGVRLNTPIFRAGHLQNILRLDPNITQDLEVINGSASPLYGSDALGGVLSVNTIKPSLSMNQKSAENTIGGAFRMASGDFQYWNQHSSAHVFHNIGFKKLAIRTAFTFNDFGDLRQGGLQIRDEWKKKDYVTQVGGTDSAQVNNDPLLQKGSGYKQIDFAQRWLFAPTNGPEHQLNIQFTRSSNVNRYDRLSESNALGQPSYAEWYYGPEERALASYQLKFKKENRFFTEATIITAWQLNKESRNTRRFGNQNLNSRLEEVNSYSLNADLHKKFIKWDVYYGLEAYSHFIGSEAFLKDIYSGESSFTSTRYPAGGSVVKNASTYVTVQRKHLASKKLISTLGLRYTYNQLNADFGNDDFFPFPFQNAEQKNSVLCAQAGLVYKASRKLNLRVQWSQGFRSPNVDDLAKVFDSQPGLLIVPNPNLRPERTNGFDLGLNFRPVESVLLEFGGFYTLLENAIVTRPFTLGNQDSLIYDGQVSAIQANVNASKAEISGVNGRVKWTIQNKTSVSASATYTKGIVYSEGDSAPLDHIPPLFGKVELARKFSSRLSVSTWTIFQGEKPLNLYSPGGEDNLQYATADGMPSWFTINAKAEIRVSKNFDLGVTLENLLDRNYRVFASGISSPGRLLRISLSMKL
ncbi:MAG: TonB-dependent receptor [Bacteroidia bacterium]